MHRGPESPSGGEPVAKPVDPREEIMDAIWPIEKLMSYFRTRRCVLRGEPLWALNKRDLESRGLMTPLKFNLFQSVLSAAPGTLLALLLVFFFPTLFRILKLILGDPFNQLQDILNNLKMFGDLLQQNAGGTALSMQATVYKEKVVLILYPIVSPLVLGIAAAGASYGSLRRRDWNTGRVRQAGSAYLYYDASMGLWYQTVLALLAVVM